MLTLTEALAAIARGTLTREQWMRDCLERWRRFEPQVHAFAWLDPEAVLQRARQADDAPRGKLCGTPIAIKDIIATRGIPTGMGSPAFADNVPERSAAIVERLEQAGAIVMGKTVTAELAYFTPGPTRNPWNAAHTPGGSSSGSAAAVAAGFVPAAVGTQTNGSMIRPAAFCGCVGYKPTRGRIPREGALEFSATLDQIGFYSRSVADAALLDSAVTQSDLPAALKGAPRLLAVRTPMWEKADAQAQSHFTNVLSRLREAGAGIEESELPPGFRDAYEVHRVIMFAEGSRALDAVQEQHRALLTARINALIDEGRSISAEQLAAALREREEYIRQLDAFLEGFDAIVTLPATGPAPATRTVTGDPVFCTLWTLAGASAISLPSGFSRSGLPLGTQLVAAPGQDALLLATAAWCESVFGRGRLAFGQ
jgi:amidase